MWCNKTPLLLSLIFLEPILGQIPHLTHNLLPREVNPIRDFTIANSAISEPCQEHVQDFVGILKKPAELSKPDARWALKSKPYVSLESQSFPDS